MTEQLKTNLMMKVAFKDLIEEGPGCSIEVTRGHGQAHVKISTKEYDSEAVVCLRRNNLLALKKAIDEAYSQLDNKEYVEESLYEA